MFLYLLNNVLNKFSKLNIVLKSLGFNGLVFFFLSVRFSRNNLFRVYKKKYKLINNSYFEDMGIEEDIVEGIVEGIVETFH
jgi:hypothetical protein